MLTCGPVAQHRSKHEHMSPAQLLQYNTMACLTVPVHEGHDALA